MKKRIRWPWFASVPSLLVLLVQWILDRAGLRTIYAFPYYALRTLAATALVVGIGFLAASHFQGRRAGSVVRIVSVVAAVLVALVGFLLSVVNCAFTPAPIAVYTSPDKSHQIVALVDGWVVDCFYLAYPLKWGFYKDESIFPVAHMDQSTKDVQVRWLDDSSARVYFVFDQAAGPVEQDSILVNFH